MKIRNTFSLILLFLLCSHAKVHDYYLSTTVVRHVEEKSEIQVVSKLFLEDVEDYLNLEREQPFVLAPDNFPVAIEREIELFFQSQFQLLVNQQNYPIQYLGKSYEEDLIVLYGYVTLEQEPEEIVFDNRFLLDFLPSQQNIIHFKSSQKNKSFLAESGKTRFRLVL